MLHITHVQTQRCVFEEEQTRDTSLVLLLSRLACFWKGNGHQGIFSSVKGTLWGNCKCLLKHFKGTKAITRGHGGNRRRCLLKVSGLLALWQSRHSILSTHFGAFQPRTTWCSVTVKTHHLHYDCLFVRVLLTINFPLINDYISFRMKIPWICRHVMGKRVCWKCWLYSCVKTVPCCVLKCAL